MKTSLLLIAAVSAQIASAQYYSDGSPRVNRQLRGLEGHTKSSTKSSEPKAEVVKENKGASEKAASEKGAKSEKV